MMYARIEAEAIVSTGALPDSVRNDDGTIMSGLQYATPDQLAAFGWVEVTDADAPELRPGEAASSSIELVDGVPTVVWTVVAQTPTVEDRIAELEAAKADVDAIKAVLIDKAVVTEKEVNDAKDVIAAEVVAVAEVGVIGGR